MKKTRKITFEEYDNAISLLAQKIKASGKKYTAIYGIPRGGYYPSSRTCSVCQYVNEHLSLRDRHWTCPECGTHHDRDANAATNILRQGIASSGSTRKTKVRLRKVC